MLPLLISPVIAIVGTMLVYKTLRFLRQRMGLHKQTCICVGKEIVEVVAPGADAQVVLSNITVQMPSVSVGDLPVCKERYAGRVMGITVDTIIDRLHFLSSGVVGFARGLNDTPKIAAILLAGSSVSQNFAIIAVGVFIAIGGLISARKVAETLSIPGNLFS